MGLSILPFRLQLRVDGESYPRKQTSNKHRLTIHRGRIQTERQRDPKFSYSPTNRFNSYAESAVYFGALQDAKTATVPLEFIKVLFSMWPHTLF